MENVIILGTGCAGFTAGIYSAEFLAHPRNRTPQRLAVLPVHPAQIRERKKQDSYWIAGRKGTFSIRTALRRRRAQVPIQESPLTRMTSGQVSPTGDLRQRSIVRQPDPHQIRTSRKIETARRSTNGISCRTRENRSPRRNPEWLPQTAGRISKQKNLSHSVPLSTNGRLAQPLGRNGRSQIPAWQRKPAPTSLTG